MNSFTLLHPNIQEKLLNSGFKVLTPIQKAAIPSIIEKNNVLLIAGTSGGKTEAALFPVLSMIAEESQISIKVIYVAPLKALLNNLEDRIKNYADWVYKTAFKWHGDVSQAKKIKSLSNPVDILIITPESIEVMLISRKIDKTVFNDVRFFIIDEVHNFAESDRGIHLVSLMNRVQSYSNHPVQVIGMSATIANPDEVMDWLIVNKNLPKKVIQDLSATKEKRWFMNYREDFQTAMTSIEKIIMNKKSIIFVKSRSLAEKASHAFKYIAPFIHHASIDKDLREEAEEKMNSKDNNCVISTSTLELGIDIGCLNLIVQYNPPPSISSLLQRIGRNGRRDKEIPTAYCFCEEQLDILITTAMINCAEKKIISPIHLIDKNYHLFFHQILCSIFERSGILKKVIYKIRDMNKSFIGITDPEIEELMDFWLNNEFLRYDGQVYLIGNKADEKLSFKNYSALYSTFYSSDEYDVYNYKTRIGSLDPGFVIDKIVPFNFTLAGKNWTAIEIDHDYMIVLAEPTIESKEPYWGSCYENFVEKEVAEECYDLLTGKEPAENITFDNAGKQILEYLRKTIPTKSFIKGNKAYLITFAGTKINYTLGLIIQALSGFEVENYFHQIGIYKKGINVTEIISTINDFLFNKISGMKIQDIEKLILPFFTNSATYSKFATFLPEEYNRKYLIYKNCDIKGSIDWLLINKLNCIEYISNQEFLKNN